jgi:hypothetical protein
MKYSYYYIAFFVFLKSIKLDKKNKDKLTSITGNSIVYLDAGFIALLENSHLVIDLEIKKFRSL